ncbi:hypothetical protein [Paraburkholderia ribeironis]|uniref:hypothetical protein n=1 Tax=Paraburkholderia ribeironis TaxID=1247936 RepID=UPI001FE8E8B9|nr:hypothetical protein [Paraburkholderia ribeironis]
MLTLHGASMVRARDRCETFLLPEAYVYTRPENGGAFDIEAARNEERYELNGEALDEAQAPYAALVIIEQTARR